MAKALKIPAHKTVTVNGEEHNVVAEKLSYEDVVQLTTKGPVPDTSGFKVTYKNRKLRGSLRPGQDVTVDAGMVFNAARKTKRVR